MAFKLAEAYVQLSQRGFQQVEGSVGRIKGGLAGMKTGLNAVNIAIGAIVAGGMVRVFKGFVDAASEAERQTAKLDGVLKATGFAAGLTSLQMRTLASDLQQVTAFEDDATVGAMAILATFKSVQGDTFRMAVKLSQDIATVFETDMTSAATMIGKALEDPIRGVTALRKAGISFTEEQKDALKGLVEQGEKAAAQAIILKEIGSQVGGSAKAVGDTAFGQMEQAKNKFGDLAEKIGGLLTPAVVELAKAMTNLLDMFPAFSKPTTTRDIMDQMESRDAEMNAIQNDIRNATTFKEMQTALERGRRWTVGQQRKSDEQAAQVDSGWSWWSKSPNERTAEKERIAARSRGYGQRMKQWRDMAQARDPELGHLTPDEKRAVKNRRESSAWKTAGSAASGAARFSGDLAHQMFSGFAGAFRGVEAKLDKEATWLKDELSSSLRQEQLLKDIYDRLAPKKDTAVFAE